MTRRIRQRVRRLVTITTVAAMCAACAADNGASATNTVRDSAGIRIVESSSPMLPADAWVLSTTPSVEIGANESDSTQILDQVETAVRLSDGRIVIANAAAPSLRWYDANGKFDRGAGRYGQGPGEFDGGEGSVWIYAVWAMPGDSVATWEHSRRRMQVFDPQGRYVRAVVNDLPPNMPQMAYPQTSGPVAGGLLAYLLDERPDTGKLGVMKRDSVNLFTYSHDGKFAKQLARLPGYVRFLMEIRRPGRSEAFRASLSVPFAPAFSLWPDGDRVFYGAADQYEILVFDTSGTVRTIIRRPEQRRPVTGELIDRYKSGRIEAAGKNPDMIRDVEETLRLLPFPDSLPSFRRFRVDREGYLWVQDYFTTGVATAAWAVFDKDGRWVTTVPIPTAWRIVDIGRDYILTVETGELDVERVRLYPLQRTGQ
jgi:hypothetical protein